MCYLNWLYCLLVTGLYHHITLLSEAQKKSTFVIPIGKLEFKKVPFDITQAPAHFQKLMNEVLNGLLFSLGYLDDILIFSKNAKEHPKHLRIVFNRFRTANLKLKR